MPRWICLLLVVQLLAGLSGCQGRETPDRAIPPLAGTAVDSLERRGKKLTAYWEGNEAPILSGFTNLYNCEVLQVDDADYPYRLWIFGETTSQADNPHRGYDSIYHGRGKTLTEWEMYCGEGEWDKTQNPELWVPVLYRDGLKNYDSVHNGDPSVVYREGRYYMAFSSVGFDYRGKQTYIINCIMGATSQDGIHWEKTAAPILIWEKEYEESWLLGEPKPPSTGGYHRPSLLWDEQEAQWKLWFDYYLPGTFLSMGYAVNTGDFRNPKDWKLIHAEDHPQLRNWPNPDVIQVGGRYYSCSDPTGFGTALGPQNDRQIVIAYSENGWDWTVLGRMQPEERQYGTHSPQFALLEEDGIPYLYLFYSLVSEETLPKYSAANFMRIPVSQLEVLIRS